MTSTFDSMAAVRMPLCLVLDSAASLALGYFKMGLAELALHVLRLKAPDAQQFLKQAAKGKLPQRAGQQEVCSFCVRQLKAAEVDQTANFSGISKGGESRCHSFQKNLHVLQAAGGFVLLHATATAGIFRRDARRCIELDTREAILAGIQSLEVLLAAWEYAKKALSRVPLPAEVQAFASEAMLLTGRMCSCLASGGYGGTAAELLSRCLHRVAPFEIRTASCYWPFWWQLVHLLAGRGDWSEAQRICFAASKAISAALDETPAAQWRRDAGYKRLLFTALLVKCKMWTQALQPTGANSAQTTRELPVWHNPVSTAGLFSC